MRPVSTVDSREDMASSNAADAPKHGAAAYAVVSSTVGVHSSICPSSPPAKLSTMESYGSTVMPQVYVVTTTGVLTRRKRSR
ncbi:hypothetical protein V491_02850 [Pseudogymnoascus sp. VKM F-3775]|nr:hypothetical protein V491_02850 [Pseudogymnoascus sp. VKM F-3775]